MSEDAWHQVVVEHDADAGGLSVIFDGAPIAYVPSARLALPNILEFVT